MKSGNWFWVAILVTCWWEGSYSGPILPGRDCPYELGSQDRAREECGPWVVDAGLVTLLNAEDPEKWREEVARARTLALEGRFDPSKLEATKRLRLIPILPETAAERRHLEGKQVIFPVLQRNTFSNSYDESLRFHQPALFKTSATWRLVQGTVELMTWDGTVRVAESVVIATPGGGESFGGGPDAVPIADVAFIWVKD